MLRRRRKGLPQLPAGCDAELRVHLPEVPLDRAGAQEELRADLRVREAVTREARDLLLLRGELIARLVCAFPDGCPRRHELPPGALGERLHADLDEDVVGALKLLARVDAAPLAPQPFTVEQV